jgi:cytidyltransferase-like protein
MRIYIDGIFDVFHRGHVEILKKAKNYRYNTTLIVGILSDKVATEYKRKPIYNEDDRYSIIESIRYVDEIIFDASFLH